MFRSNGWSALPALFTSLARYAVGRCDGGQTARRLRARPARSEQPPGLSLHRLAEPSAHPALCGGEVGALRRIAERWPVPETLVLSGPLDRWADPEAVSRLLAPALTARTEPLTVRGTLVRPDGSSRPVGPVWHNLPPDTADQAVIELAALAVRDAETPAAREAYAPATQVLVVLLQQFVPAEVSVRGTVDQAGAEVRLLSCHGLDEDLGQGVWRDVTVLDRRTRTVLRQQVTTKPTATCPADGGTRTAEVAPRLRNAPTVTPALVPRLADLSTAVVAAAGGTAHFELAVLAGEVHLLSCRPVAAPCRAEVPPGTHRSGAEACAPAPTVG